MKKQIVKESKGRSSLAYEERSIDAVKSGKVYSALEFKYLIFNSLVEAEAGAKANPRLSIIVEFVSSCVASNINVNTGLEWVRLMLQELVASELVKTFTKAEFDLLCGTA